MRGEQLEDELRTSAKKVGRFVEKCANVGFLQGEGLYEFGGLWSGCSGDLCFHECHLYVLIGHARGGEPRLREQANRIRFFGAYAVAGFFL